MLAYKKNLSLTHTNTSFYAYFHAKFALRKGKKLSRNFNDLLPFMNFALTLTIEEVYSTFWGLLQETLYNIFKLFDVDGNESLKQDQWIENIKGRLT